MFLRQIVEIETSLAGSEAAADEPSKAAPSDANTTPSPARQPAWQLIQQAARIMAVCPRSPLQQPQLYWGQICHQGWLGAAGAASSLSPLQPQPTCLNMFSLLYNCSG